MPTVTPGNTKWDKNLYAYCDNNPVLRKDTGGDLWELVALGGVIGGAFELGSQLIDNGGDFSSVNWLQVGIAVMDGALSVVTGPEFSWIISGASSCAIEFAGGERDPAKLTETAIIGSTASLIGSSASYISELRGTTKAFNSLSMQSKTQQKKIINSAMNIPGNQRNAFKRMNLTNCNNNYVRKIGNNLVNKKICTACGTTASGTFGFVAKRLTV